MVTITYLYDGTSLDVDNVPKPILDALNGLVFADDSQVTDMICRKRDLNGELRVPDASRVLLATFRQSEESLHVIVAHAPSQEVEL